MHYTTIDFRLPKTSETNYSSLPSDNKVETINREHWKYWKEHIGQYKELFIYLIVILVLQLMNSLIRKSHSRNPTNEPKLTKHLKFPLEVEQMFRVA